MFRSAFPAVSELPETDLATAPCLPARFEVVYSRDVAVKKKVEVPWTQGHPNLVWLLPIVISVLVSLGMGFSHFGAHYFTLTVESEINSRTQSLGTQIGQISDRVSKIEGQLQILIEEQMKNSASLNPSDFKAAVPALRSVAAAATAAHINIDPQIVEKAGNRILEIASVEPENSTVWNAATAFLNYRSRVSH